MRCRTPRSLVPGLVGMKENEGDCKVSKFGRFGILCDLLMGVLLSQPRKDLAGGG